MAAADHEVRELDPLRDEPPAAPALRLGAPIVARLHALWAAGREAVLGEFPKPPGLPEDPEAYLQQIDEVYQEDAYHSLSIEGYQVTPELVERVATGGWDPELTSSDRESSSALAARGYWLAFQRAKATVRRILISSGRIDMLRSAHREWYREMFSPQVAAGLLGPSSLAGYRSHPVYLRGSRHVPPRSDVLGDAMAALFDLIEGDAEPAVRAVLGHWLMGYVHPFPDGNGRIARLLMNALLAAGGYPWTVIRVEDRTAYLAALETASVEGDVRPFARFVAAQARRAKAVTAHPRSRRAGPRARRRT